MNSLNLLPADFDITLLAGCATAHLDDPYLRAPEGPGDFTSPTDVVTANAETGAAP